MGVGVRAVAVFVGLREHLDSNLHSGCAPTGAFEPGALEKSYQFSNSPTVYVTATSFPALCLNLYNGI